MRLFGSVSGRQVDEFARTLAEDLSKLVPSGNQKGSGNPVASLNKLERKVDDLCSKAAAFRKEHKLGIYKKARLANTFRWELKTRGHDEGFIEAVTEKLVVAVSKKD